MSEFKMDELMQSGWLYIDPPGKFTPEMWDLFLSIIGEGNYEILIMSESTVPGQEWKRGQLIVSPDGVVNMQRYQFKEKE